MSTVTTVPTAALATRKSGRYLYIASVGLLCAWVIVPLYFLLINTLSSPETVNGFPKPFIPEFDMGSMSFFAGYGGMLSALKNSIIVAVMTMVLSISSTGSHHIGNSVCGTHHVLAFFRYTHRIGRSSMDFRLHTLYGVYKSRTSPDFARHCGVCNLCFCHLMERGIRRGRPDHREPNTHRIFIGETGRGAFALKVCRRVYSGGASVGLHIRCA